MATKRKMKRFEEGGEAEAPEMATATPVADASPAEVTELEKLPVRAAPAARTARADIVTPAQMKAAGFDNLRDYLNDKQGLTRRGSPAVEKTVTAAPATPMAKPVKMSREESIAQIPTSGYRKVAEGESASGSEVGRNLSALMNGTGPGKLATGLTLAAREYTAANAVRRAMEAKAAKEVAARTARVATRRQAAGAKEALRRDATFEGGMARGGKVSSASRRADGIAQRGKTRI
jgi:hypothetical protein